MDEARFEAMVAHHRRALVRHCARLVGEADAEEAVQEALMKAYQALDRGLEVRAVEPWLRAIAHNTAINMLRARGARPVATPLECECAQRTDDSADHREELRAVLDVVGELPARQRDAIVMRELEGRSYDEIGARLGASHGAVRQLLNRARNSVRERLGAVAALEPLTRWLGETGAAGGCAIGAKLCAAALLPATIGGATAISVAGVDRPAATNAPTAVRSTTATAPAVRAATGPIVLRHAAPAPASSPYPSVKPSGRQSVTSSRPHHTQANQPHFQPSSSSNPPQNAGFSGNGGQTMMSPNQAGPHAAQPPAAHAPPGGPAHAPVRSQFH